MRLHNEAMVAAPPEATWTALLDVPRIARALPGATVDPEPVEGAYRGTLTVRLGPVTMEYEGVVRLEDADEDARVATFHLQGREARGHGGATATITNRLTAVDGGTRVAVETDVAVTGRAAQFGRGLMEDVAGRMIEQFARRLEGEVLTGEAADGGLYAARDEAGGVVLDVGAAAWRPLLRRYGPAVGVGVLALVTLAAALRTRRVVVIVVERR